MLIDWKALYPLQVHELLGSTSSFAKQSILKQGMQSGLVQAKQQTTGRGRGNKQWVSEIGNLYFSFFNQCPYSAQESSWLCSVAALAIYDAVRSFLQASGSSTDIFIKWPNDIIVNDSKLAGILVERVQYQERAYFIIGIGVNVKHSPDNIDQETTSLSDLGHDIAIASLRDKIMQFFCMWQHRWEAEGSKVIMSAMNEYLYQRNQIIEATLPGGNIVRGKIKGLNSAANLLLQTENGHIDEIITAVIH